MLFSTDHAVGLARDLADRLTIRLTNGTGLNTVRQTQDSNGYPILIVSHNATETESNSVIWIKLTNIDVGATDIFGNATLPFSPTLCQFAYELNSAGAPIPTTADYTTCLFEVVRMGTVLSEIAIANGTAVTQTSVSAATPVQTLKDIDWGYKGNA